MKGLKLLQYFSIPDLNLLSCELGNFTFKVLYWVNLYWYYIKKIKIQYSNSSIWKIQFTFTTSKIKNIVVFAFGSRARFPVKWIFSIAFGSASRAYYLLKSIDIIFYKIYWNSYNLIQNQSCNPFLDQSQLFECFHMFLNYFLSDDPKSYVHRS